MNPIETFLIDLSGGLIDGSFRKLTLGKFRGAQAELEHIYLRPVVAKGESKISATYRYPTRDITKNYSPNEVTDLLRDWLGKTCLAATFFSATSTMQLLFNRRGKPRLQRSGQAKSDPAPWQHDHQKLRLLKDERFLEHLGVIDRQGKPKTQMGDKYRQIHHFVEIIAPLLKDHPKDDLLRIADMGSGKGYLTFALHAFLQQEGYRLSTLGIERRADLVQLCNQVAEECGFLDLRFEMGEIAGAKIDAVDMLIALHACDTATDEALYMGMHLGADWILAAPCCHKELRPQIQAPPGFEPLFRHGIQMDRMSEFLTDSLRALCLEANGYVSRIQEFISLEHTTKNLLLVGTKNRQQVHSERSFERIEEFQRQFGIKQQRLVNLLRQARR